MRRHTHTRRPVDRRSDPQIAELIDRASREARRRPSGSSSGGRKGRGTSRAHARTRARAKTPSRLPLIAAIVLLVVGGVAVALMAPGGTRAASRVWNAAAESATATSPSASAQAAAKPAAPTPAFGAFRGRRLHLPVVASAVTVLAFHESSYNDTYQMKWLVPQGSMSAAAAKTNAAKAAHIPVHATPTGAAEDANGIWTGSALELWRTGRAGRRDTAIDCGAKPGTTVLPLLSGTVMEIRPYKLYGKYSDYEIHVRPDGWSDVDVVTLHVTDPEVQLGQHVVAGVTPLAKVRHLSAIVHGLQLRTYSTDGGNHTHVQINKVPRPDLLWKLGCDPPGTVRKSP